MLPEPVTSIAIADQTFLLHQKPTWVPSYRASFGLLNYPSNTQGAAAAAAAAAATSAKPYMRAACSCAIFAASAG